MSPELSIIIVNWNAGDLLQRSVESIVNSQLCVSYEIVIVDNASTDNSLQLLRTTEPSAHLVQEGRLRIIENADNKGFGSANNQAFQLTNSPFLLLLNPDTEILSGSIDRLIKSLRTDSRMGACGPKILNTDGSVQSSVWRNPPTAWEIVLSNLKLYLLLPKRVRGELLLGGHWDHNRRRYVRMLSGACILARREVIDEVGGFDERFHLYAEDHEWCLRVVRAGWKLGFEPASIVLHHGSRSSLKRWSSLDKLRVQLEASYLFQKHSLPRRQVVANLLASFLTAYAQRAWRRMRGIDAPEVELATDLHRAFLLQTLRNKTPREQ